MTVQMLKAHDIGDGEFSIVRSKLFSGELVKVPIRGSTYTTAVATGGAVTYSASVGSNEDGTQQNLNMSVPPGVLPATASAAVRNQIWGRQVGIRWRRDSNAQPPLITVVIDGVAYSYANANVRRDNITAAATDTEALWLVADDLADGPHTVEVIVAQDPAGSATYTLNLFGWIAERRAGYEQKVRPDFINSTPTALTTSLVQIPNVNNAAADVRAVRKLHFYNSDTVTRLVTIAFNSNTFKVLSIPTVTHAEYDFGEPTNVSTSLWKWKADAGAVVNAWVQGAI